MPKLAAAIRAKYPGAYDDMDDATLEATVKAKYPGVYDDFENEPDPLPKIVEPGPQPYRGMLREGRLPTWDEAKQAFYETSPLPNLEKENLPRTLGTLAAIPAGIALGAATAPVAATIALPALLGGSVAASTKWAQGGTPGEQFKEFALQAGPDMLIPSVGRVLGNAGRMMYRGGLRAVGTPVEVDDLIETGIREGITASRKGWRNAQSKIDRLNEAVRNIVEKTPGTANPQVALGNLQKLRNEMAGPNSGATADQIAAVDRAIEHYAQQWAKPGGHSAVDAHLTKVDLQRRAKPGYDQDLPTAAREAQMQAAAGWRKETERLAKEAGAPDISSLNARIGKLHELQDVVVQAPARFRASDINAARYAGPKGLAVQLGLRSAPMTAVGRRMARFGDFFDPSRGVNLFVNHPVAGGRSFPADWAGPTPGTPRTLDQLGIPETAGPAWQRDALDAVGVPVERKVSSPEEMWELALRQERGPTLSPGPRSDFPLETQVTYTPEEIALLRAGVPKDALADDSWVRLASPSRTEASTVTRGTDPLEVLQQTNPHTLDQVGVPLGRREAPWAPDQLDALGIPQTDPGRATSDELWLRQLAGKERGRLGSRTEDIAQRTGVHANQPGAKTAVNNASPSTITATSVKEMHARLQRVRKELEAAMKARKLKQQDLF